MSNLFKKKVKNQLFKISILMPVYNREKYIKESVDSILNQTYRNINLIIYDDGSTDNTLNLIPKDDRIKIIKGAENLGVAYARNVLIREAKTKYCMWQDSDDFSSKDRIMKNLNYLSTFKDETSRPDMVFSNIIFFKKGQNPFRRGAKVYKIDISKYPLGNGLNGNNITFATGFFDLERCKLQSFDNKKTNGGEDLDWLIRLYNDSPKMKCGYLDENLYYCRRHEGRISFKKTFKRLKDQGLDPYENGWIKAHISSDGKK